ncbi:alpha/beta hydrolase [Streptomyces sp. 150FB]|nr:alpha/beta hydrolase [Streptomyces sp. 150FB]
MSISPLFVHSWGSGPEVVLVHGVVLGGRECWRAQRPLTERWTLVAPDRPGHGKSGPARQDFETESVLVADQLLDRPVHLVGHSYGAIVAMHAAARRPENVRSLVVVEPPATAVAKGDPEIDELGARLRALTLSDEPAETVLPRLFKLIGVSQELPSPLPPTLVKGARQLMGGRPADEAEPPLERLRESSFPILVVTGAHSRPFEVIGDVIADRTGAERVTCPGAGHQVPETGAPFNTLLADFFQKAS